MATLVDATYDHVGMADDSPGGFCCREDLDRIGCDGRSAEADLRAWRSAGPRATTRELIEAIRAEGVEGASLLDVGAGVGAVHIELLEAGAASAVDVDASRDYLRTAQEEAERRGLADRVDYRHGDLVHLADEVPRADIVTLDLVICCYPALGPLVRAAVRGRPRLVGLVHPRDRWWARAGMRACNAAWTLLRRPDRWYIHRERDLEGLLSRAGLERRYEGGSRFWRVAVYGRAA